MNIVAESYATKQMKCQKCGWVPHKIYPLSQRVECTFCHDRRGLRPHEVPAEIMTHGGPEKRV